MLVGDKILTTEDERQWYVTAVDKRRGLVMLYDPETLDRGTIPFSKVAAIL
jgi:hypothetical protein